MPILRTAEKVEQLYLPSTESATDPSEKAWVAMDVSPRKIGDMEDVNLTSKGEGALLITIVASRIREWNFTDEQGELLPITYDTVKLIDYEDFQFLIGKIQKINPSLTDEEKKTSSPTSQPDGTVKVPVQ